MSIQKVPLLCFAENTNCCSYCVEKAIITVVTWMADRAYCVNERCGTEGFPTKYVCTHTTHIWCKLNAHTHFECLRISQHAHYCLLPGWCRHVLCRTRSQLFLIFSSTSQRIFICGSRVAGELFSNVNNRRGTTWGVCKLMHPARSHSCTGETQTINARHYIVIA